MQIAHTQWSDLLENIHCKKYALKLVDRGKKGNRFSHLEGLTLICNFSALMAGLVL